jgi:hypothetical protein
MHATNPSQKAQQNNDYSDDEDSISGHFNKQRRNLLKSNVPLKANPTIASNPWVNVTDNGDHITIDDKVALLKTRYFYKALDPLPAFGGFFPRFTIPKTFTA